MKLERADPCESSDTSLVENKMFFLGENEKKDMEQYKCSARDND